MNRLIRRISRRARNSEGFSLLEAMISLLVFSIGIMGVATLQTTSVSNNTLAEDVQINTVTAMALVEELMATDFKDQRIWLNPPGCNPAPNDPSSFICIDYLDDDAIPGAKKVLVTTRFTPAGGVEQRVTLAIMKPDIDKETP